MIRESGRISLLVVESQAALASRAACVRLEFVLNSVRLR